MAAPSYTTDLALIHACDAASASWTEPTGFLGGAITLPETDYFIQNTGCLSKNCGTTTPVGVGAIYNAGSGLTIPSPGAVMIWLYFGAPNTLAVQYPGGSNNGGLQVFIGSATSAFKQWFVRGSDTYPYGGWICIPVDPTVAANLTTGSPTSTTQYFGAGAYIPGPAIASKGNPFGVDILRYGRCEARMNGGETGNYATFSGFAATNDLIANRWGLIQAVQGGYLMQGLVVLGYSSAVDFRDSNKSIIIANTEKVVSSFNAIEVRNTSSRVDWTNISFTTLGTVSRGNFITTDNADINIAGCTFTDMGTFSFQSSGTILTSTFRRCNLVTQNSAVFTGCTFDNTNDSVKTVLSNNPANISNCTFISSGTKHAIELTAACAGQTYSFTGNTFTGYAATDGSTGNEVIYNNSGGAVTINHSGTTGTISVKNGNGATTTVAVSAVLTIEIRNSDNGDLITGNCEVTVVKASDETVLFHEDDITDGITAYSYSSGSGTAVYINVLNVSGYQNKTVYQNLAATNETAKIFLDTDRIFSNP